MDTINSAIGECCPIPRLQVAARTAQAPPVGGIWPGHWPRAARQSRALPDIAQHSLAEPK